MAAPGVSGITLAKSAVGQYEIEEVSAEIQTTAQNPYWPYDAAPPVSIPAGTGVSVDGLFSDDDWATTVVVPAFYYQECQRHLVSGTGTLFSDEAVEPAGQPGWRIRFAPPRIGTWKVRVRVQDATGTTTSAVSDAQGFSCNAGASHGFVGVCTRDPRYFQLTDGTPLIALGVNAQFHTTYEAESLLQTLGQNRVSAVRWMMTYRGWQNPFGGGSQDTLGGPQWEFGLYLSNGGGAKSGDRYSGSLIAGRDTKQRFYAVLGRQYRLTGSIRTDSVSVVQGKGVTPYVASASGTPITGTQGWSTFSIDFTPPATGTYYAGVKHTGSDGTGYFDDLSLRYSTDGVTWSGNCLVKADMDFENYVDLIEAWKVDRVFDAALANGVYLKSVITEKQDQTLGSIGADGSAVARSDDNFYASANHPSRWLQRAWWRYMSARWGAYTCLHSWELCNEGDPADGNHWNAANALADYVHGLYPRRLMCTTSFWHSLPMEFWKTSSVDYLDVHEYLGPFVSTTGSHGPRFYAFGDPLTLASDATGLFPYDCAGYTSSLETVNVAAGSRCLRVVTKPTSDWFASAYPEYHIGIDPAKTYDLRFKARADGVQNQGGDRSWAKPGASIAWSKEYHENDYISETDVSAGLGTYDWMTVEQKGIQPPATANTANIQLRAPASSSGSSTFWVDDIQFIDETSGKNLIVDGGFEGDRIDYDGALAVRKYGVLFGSYGVRVSRPVVWGETGIRGLNIHGSPYKGYSYSDESQELVDDTAGIHIKKMIWAHAGADNPNMLYWWTDNISRKGLWHYFRAFETFMDGIPLSNGSYQDAEATPSLPALRAWGQKDLVNNRAHLWIDNVAYTWKNVVDDVAVPPVTGSVTITGLKDGAYKAEWWDTSAGSVVRTDDVTCSSGTIALPVSSLQSDEACKLYPAPAKISLRILTPSAEVVPGQAVTITVEYTNAGETDAKSAVVTAKVPAEMDYVTGSAEASQGTWDAASNAVSWVIGSIAPHSVGRVTFQARVR